MPVGASDRGRGGGEGEGFGGGEGGEAAAVVGGGWELGGWGAGWGVDCGVAGVGCCGWRGGLRVWLGLTLANVVVVVVAAEERAGWGSACEGGFGDSGGGGISGCGGGSSRYFE